MRPSSADREARLPDESNGRKSLKAKSGQSGEPPEVDPAPSWGIRLFFFRSIFASLRIDLSKSRKSALDDLDEVRLDPSPAEGSRPSPRAIGRPVDAEILEPSPWPIAAPESVHPAVPKEFTKPRPDWGLPYCRTGRSCVSLSPCRPGRARDESPGVAPIGRRGRGTVFAFSTRHTGTDALKNDITSRRYASARLRSLRRPASSPGAGMCPSSIAGRKD